jgi:heavy metal sensor kinase
VTKRRTRSIQFRLTAWYTVILAFTFTLIGIGVWLALNHSIEETADRELRSRLTDVRHYVDGFSPDDLEHMEEEFSEESLLGQAAANIRIADAQGKWLFRTPGTESWPVELLLTNNLPLRGRLTTIKVGHGVIRVLTARVRVGTAQIGLPIDEFEEVRNGFLWLIALGSPILLLLAWMGGYWISGRALKPVDEISRAAASIGANGPSDRLPSTGAGDELDRLSEVLNGMLARLEDAFRRVTEFTADASHELRTPVAVIQTTAELMQTRPRTPEEHMAAWNRVSAETQRTADLISDLLTLARADAGKSDLEFESVDLTGVVLAAVEEMRILADSKGLSLVQIACPSARVLGDVDALRRAVSILLDNSIKYTTAPGSVRVEVKSENSVEVVVADTGLGIGEEDLPMIFERFYRVSKDRSRKTGGTGLGLAIGKWIVEQHGGEIRTESLPGKGSTFTMVLPKLLL